MSRSDFIQCGAQMRAAAAALSLIFGIFLCCGTVFAEKTSTPAARHEDTNVILISLQCLRPDHMGAYGYKRNTTPNMDAFARRSAVFENVVAEANLTPVAQMSILTSQYARMHGMVSFEVAKDTVSGRSLPEILRYYGYTTAAVSSSPEFFMRFDTASGTVINPGDVFSRSFDYFGSSRRGMGGGGIRKLPVESFQWIKENKDRKFFLWIASGLIHMPYAESVPAPHKTMFDPPHYTPFWKRLPGLTEGMTRGEDPSYDIFSRVRQGEFYWGFSPVYRLTEDDVRYVNARYDAGVYYTDLFIGELLKLLDSLKLTRKTLIVIHSSHGDDLGERGEFFHYDVSEGVIRDVLIMGFPGSEFGGRRVGQLAGGMDIMPTILDYLGIPVPHEAQGGSLLPVLRGEASTAREEVYIDRIPWWEYTLSKWYLEFQGGKGAHFPESERPALREYLTMLQTEFSRLDYPPGDIAVRTPEWKLILRKNINLLNKVSWWSFITGSRVDADEVVLYDLRSDPGETKNVAGDHPEVVSALKARLVAWDERVERRKARYRKDEKRWIIPYP